ncbi:unnamed protein product [Rotaria sp. Silwood2]|nr:unnamed protein product [Rotaria sp. Silwood2]CAF2659244.1 unnamed protein product [Rotaria sp. Silwood2]CAF2910428.1 unnamed protein product [Rotaria sp. Silwood2]CAF3026344.1 unnamed protein product [Rotaria sp. Silwood2]CAF3879770.1 unnamed protein product [Rotaria sp. Silwood2]
MAFETFQQTSAKKRRIMIITGDESIIEQIQNTDNLSLINSVIIESKDDDNYFPYSSFKGKKPASNKKRTRIGSLTCVVCGSPALGYNFDAISCESCKAFFRRNALKNPTTLQCRRQGSCEITIETRRRCSTCRLTKCFNSGMKRERLERAEEKAVKRRTIEENQTFTIQKYEMDDEKHQVLPSTSFDNLSTTKETNVFRLTDVTELQSQTSSQSRRSLLTIEDLHRVETIQNSYEQRIELAARYGLPWDPSIYATTLLQHINSRSVPIMRLLTFFKQIPEFNELNVDDKVTLIKYNLLPLIMLDGTLSYKADTGEIVETDSDVPWNSSMLEKIHGNEIYMQIQKIFNSFVRIANYDQRIIQLALIIFILTKGCSADSVIDEPILNDSMAVYRAQSYYTDLLWRYMETIHGIEKSTYIFIDLIVHFISWQTLEKQLRLNLRKVLSPNDTNELLPIMRSLLHIT